MQTDTPIERLAALVKQLWLDHATETQTNIRAKAAFQTAVKTQKTMLFVQRRTSPCVGIRWVTTFNLTLFNPGPSRVLFFSHHTWKNPWGMIEGGQTNQWRSYLLFRKKAKWRPWQSFVVEAANRLGCRRGSSSANRRDGGHSTAGSVGQANLCVCLYCGHACAAYNTPVSPCTRSFGRTGHLQIKHGSSNTSTNWGHCETNKQTS